MANSPDDRANYGFKQPYGIATLDVRPGRRALALRAGVDISEWQQTPGTGSAASIEEVYTPETLPGLGTSVTYLHSHVMVGLDRRPAADYARRGGFYGVTAHDFHASGWRLRLQAVGIRGAAARAAPSRDVGAVVPRACDDHRHQG